MRRAVRCPARRTYATARAANAPARRTFASPAEQDVAYFRAIDPSMVITDKFDLEPFNTVR